MTTTAGSTKLTAAVETCFAELGRPSGSGGATDERSTYGPLAKLLDVVGATLKPKVFCVAEPVNHGAGHPDFGLCTSKQVQKGRPRKGQLPERGVVEVKSLQWDTRATMVREQVSRYWDRYRLVLVTNLREFDLVGPDAKGGERTPESHRLADSGTEFARRLERPRTFARETGAGLGEYLSRALSHRAALTGKRLPCASVGCRVASEFTDHEACTHRTGWRLPQPATEPGSKDWSKMRETWTSSFTSSPASPRATAMPVQLDISRETRSRTRRP